MTLGELIKTLEKYPKKQIVKKGFGNPHSYRGYYEQLAFEPMDHVTVGEMLKAARSALNQTFRGYKGGDFTMYEYTDVWLAECGSSGDGLSRLLIEYMCGEHS